jgi:hypothetical protein
MLLLVLVYKYLLSSLTGHPSEKGLKLKTTFEAFYAKAALRSTSPNICFYFETSRNLWHNEFFFITENFCFTPKIHLGVCTSLSAHFTGSRWELFFSRFIFLTPAVWGETLGWELGEAMVRPLFRMIRSCPDFLSCFPGPSSTVDFL